MNDLLKKKCLCNLDSNNHCQECNLMKKLYKKMFHWKKIFKHILEITYYIYHITFSKFKSKASLFHLSLKTFVYKTKIPQTGIFLKLLGE